jgi:hypothetical protein
MKTSTLVKSVLIAASLPLIAGCVEREVVYRPAPSGGPVVTDENAPPPPQTEVVTTAPGPLTVWLWVPGCWEWRGHWVWVGGHWAARPHPGAVWIGAHWGWRGHHHVWVRGHWR